MTSCCETFGNIFFCNICCCKRDEQKHEPRSKRIEIIRTVSFTNMHAEEPRPDIDQWPNYGDVGVPQDLVSTTYIAVANYEAKQDDELSFQKGELLIWFHDNTSEKALLKSMKTQQSGYAPTDHIATLQTAHSLWFTEKLKREDSHSLLLNPVNGKGTFLIRGSNSNPGNYSLDILDEDIDGARKVHSFMIRKSDLGHYLGSNPPIPELSNIIIRYSDPSEEGYCTLTQACNLNDLDGEEYLSAISDVVEKRVALFDYTAQQPGDLTFRKGEFLTVLDKSSYPDWWLLKSLSTGLEGFGPTKFIVPEGSHEMEDWFAGKMGRTEATRQLLTPGNVAGTFLIRESITMQGHFVLHVVSVDQNGTQVVKSFLIYKSPDGSFHLKNNSSFPSLGSLVKHYSESEEEVCGKLTKPCAGSFKGPPACSIGRDVFEIDRSSLSLSNKIGSGKFGTVHRGTYRGVTEVAIKTMNTGTMSSTDFLKEAGIMKKLRHPNLVSLLAVVSKDPILIVTEFMQHGSLLDYLKTGRGNQSESSDHVDMAMQIAEGMAYIESMNYIHRDLRAANVLVGKGVTVKVADFGLARLIVVQEYKASVGSLFPVRWTAPEGLTQNQFSIKSDMWSFGILLSEIVTKGGVPYPGMDIRRVTEMVPQGHTMDQPPGCRDDLYAMMKRCWNYNPDMRPSFLTLKSELAQASDNYD